MKLVLSLYVSDNEVEYFDILDPSLVHYTAYWNIRETFLTACMSENENSLYFQLHVFSLLLSFMLQLSFEYICIIF